jgi:DNA-binding transcriptional LysR family regulator
VQHNNQTRHEGEAIDLSLLRHFVTVVETGSFTRASRRLNLSQSVVSRSVRRLEDILGVTLLERTTRTMRLTPAGEALFAETVASLDRISVAVDDARRIGRGGYASLRVGICPSVAIDTPIIQGGLRAFLREWPHIDLKIRSAIGAVQPGALRTSELDIGIMQFNPTECDGLAWHVLARSPLMVAIPSGWRLRRDRLQLAELKDYPWLLPDPALSSETFDSALAILRSAGFEPKVSGLIDDSLTARIMLGCGLGAALTYARAELQQNDGYDLVPLEVPGDVKFVETVITWASTSSSKLIGSLVNCFIAESNEQP